MPLVGFHGVQSRAFRPGLLSSARRLVAKNVRRGGVFLGRYGAVKIVSVQPILCDGGFRPWTFVKILTDEGLVGYGDCTDWGSAVTVAACIRDLEPLLVGEDPANIEAIWWKLYSKTIRAIGGITHKAISGIDSALWDIKGKRLGAPVYDLLGGRMRDSLRLYWTHCGWGRAYYSELLQKPQVRSLEDLARLAEEVREQGFTAIKTNILEFGSRRTLQWRDGNIDPQTLRTAVQVVSTFRRYGGEDLGIALDVAFSFNMGSAIRLARALEPYNMMWLETETLDPAALKTIKDSTRTPICTGESLYMTHGYKPFLESHAVDVIMPDIAWNGISMGKKIADYAQTYDVPVAPHNCHSPLTTLITAHLCMAVRNFMILELDNDDVPWRDDVLTYPLDIRNGHLYLSDRPGWGADLNEEEIAKHPYRAVPEAS